MKIFRFNEVCGKYQGKIIDITAETIEDAIKQLGADDVIPYYGQFKKFYFNNIFEVYQINGQTQYVVHRK